MQCGSRLDDGDALVAADGQQMLAVAGDDQAGARSDGDQVIVIGIVGYPRGTVVGVTKDTSAVYCASNASMLVPKPRMRAANFA